MSNAGSPDVETRTVGTRLMYFMSVLTHFTIFPLGDFYTYLRRLPRLQYIIKINQGGKDRRKTDKERESNIEKQKDR